MHSELTTQTLKGLALNREPGWNFPGNFLELSFDEVSAQGAQLSLWPGPHCADAHGETSLAALCVLADVGLSVSMRQRFGFDVRMATVSMTLSLTGVPRRGPLTFDGRFDAVVADTQVPHGLAHAAIRTGDGLVATASGMFLSLGQRAGLMAMPMRRRGHAATVAPLRTDELEADERDVLARAEAAAAGGAPGFLERFWSLAPVRTADGASCRFANGPHAGNRVGHAQGGITFALAASTSAAALDESWQLTGCSASYLAPGTGATLHAAAKIAHQGRLSAVVRTELRDDTGRFVLDAVTQHAKRA